MTGQEFGEKYLQYEENIKKVLMSREIYDEDLLHDTYIALYEDSQKNEISDFVNAYVEFYGNLLKRQEEHESHYDCHDNAHMLNFDRPDDSDLEYREQVGKRVDKLIRYYNKHPHKGERNHERAYKILKLYLEGRNFREIAKIVKLDVSVVYRYLERALKRIKEQQEMTTI